MTVSVVHTASGRPGGRLDRGRDRETRERVLRAAAGLFAGHGYGETTIREICRVAGANVAAVNYHFGDKLGLYREVLTDAIATMRATTEAAERAGAGLPAGERLHAYIRVFLRRVVGQSRDQWIHQLMLREMADPTPAIDDIVQQVIRPRVQYLCGVVGELLGLPEAHEEVLRCVLSVQAQCHAAIPNPVSHRLSVGIRVEGAAHGQGDGRAAVDRLADHIAAFSLAGIERVRRGSGDGRG